MTCASLEARFLPGTPWRGQSDIIGLSTARNMRMRWRQAVEMAMRTVESHKSQAHDAGDYLDLG